MQTVRTHIDEPRGQVTRARAHFLHARSKPKQVSTLDLQEAKQELCRINSARTQNQSQT
jgi:hypothetical protein